MNYGFRLYKVTGAVRSPDDIAEETTELLDPGLMIRQRLAALYPRIQWHHAETDRLIFGTLDGDDGWYEFVLYEDPNRSLTINTSPSAVTRWLIPDICQALGLVALDAQAYTLIGA
jgi:hypothetical protein